MEIWGFRSPDIGVKWGILPPKSKRFQFLPHEDIDFLSSKFQQNRQIEARLLKKFRKKIVVSGM